MLAPKRHLLYAVAIIGGKRVKLHRFVLDDFEAPEIDHIDGNGLNNRRNNLRAATRAENTRNQRLRSEVKTSRFKGVSRKSSVAPWIAQITVNGHVIEVGRFKSEEDAARAYDEAAKRYFREFAKTNEAMGLFDTTPSLKIGARYRSGVAV